MKRSTERILTTHVGSLPRPADLLDMMHAKARASRSTSRATRAPQERRREIVRRQIELAST